MLSESRESKVGPFDIPGVACLAIGLLAIVYALINAQGWGWGNEKTLGLIAFGIVLLVAFVIVEQKRRNPLVPLSIFADRSVSLSTAIVLLDFFALFGVLFFVGLYLQSVHGYSPVEAGVRLLPLTAAFAVSGNLGARLTERFGPAVPITGGLLATSIALLSLSTLQVDSSYVHLWPPFVLIGLGIGLVVTAATDAIVGNVPVDEAGVAGGIQTTAIQLGGVLGTAVCGSILGSIVASGLVVHLLRAGVPPDVAHVVARSAADVSQGLAPVPHRTSAQVAQRVAAGSHASFMDGLHVTMLVAGVAALVGAACGPFVRLRDNTSDEAIVPIL